jgi:beta-glucosidase
MVSTPSEGREAVDRQSIDLEPGQEALIRQVVAANPRTVVVLISSFPYAINWEQDHAPAIVHMAHNSQEEGNGLADVLFGDADPAGRLVQTWPRSLDQLPPMMDYNIRDGRTYMYFRGGPLYPFGYGLSYTTFAYSNLRTSAEHILDGGTLDVNVDVRNTGARAGDEVVQLYVHHLRSDVPRLSEQLAGFQRIPLQPGETKTVTFRLRADQLAYWNTERSRFVVEGDQVELRIGSSSADIKLSKRIEVRS